MPSSRLLLQVHVGGVQARIEAERCGFALILIAGDSACSLIPCSWHRKRMDLAQSHIEKDTFAASFSYRTMWILATAHGLNRGSGHVKGVVNFFHCCAASFLRACRQSRARVLESSVHGQLSWN